MKESCGEVLASHSGLEPYADDGNVVGLPKPDGRQRPLGVASLEDKIVQQAVLRVLQSIHEQDFLGFSYRGATP